MKTRLLLLPLFLIGRLAWAGDVVVTTTADSGPGSLRAAIGVANGQPGTQIFFNIPKKMAQDGYWSIQLKTSLPVISGDDTIIDGATQTVFADDTNPQGPEIEIRPKGERSTVTGLVITGKRVVLSSVVVNRFSADGIILDVGDARSSPDPNGTVEMCYIGLTADGEAIYLVGNGGAGIKVRDGSWQCSLSKNVISGNYGPGIKLVHSILTKIEDNVIGLDASAKWTLPNGSDGIVMDGSGTSILNNVIAGNYGNGIAISGPPAFAGNRFTGNFIGTNRQGKILLGNSANGVLVSGGLPLIGAVDSESRSNIISGNGEAGIRVSGPAFSLIGGNYIGVSPGGKSALANQWGIIMEDGAGAQIGNTGNDNGRCVISGNLRAGIWIDGPGGPGNLTDVMHNFIGTDITGTRAIPNGEGVAITGGATMVRLGSDETASGRGNVISGNRGAGVRISGEGTSHNLLVLNRIGVAAHGDAALPNGLDGVQILDGATDNQIGHRMFIDAPSNIIAGNRGNGILIDGSATNFNVVETNEIGLVAAPNGGSGVAISGGARSNRVGGTPEVANIIRGNLGAGVLVAGEISTGNTIRLNSIFANSGLQIDLAGGREEARGRTPNDELDRDLGANNLQNFPVLDTARMNRGNNKIKGTLSSRPNTRFILDFYADATGADQGSSHLASLSVETDGNGKAPFVMDLGTEGLEFGQACSATATDLERGDTSEYSPKVRVEAVPSTPPGFSGGAG